MSNVAAVLKSEIARVARKEIRSEIEGLKKASAQQRAAMAQMRREITDLHRALKQMQRAAGQAAPTPKAESAPQADGLGETPRRFSASRLESHRKKLALSAADYGKLVGVTGSTIYNWEQGKSRPTPDMVRMLAFVKLQKAADVAARLSELSAGPKSN